MELLNNAKGEEKLTPMMQQYDRIKQSYADYILFYRLGDFYEMFREDAKTASRELELALTERAGNPMCGVPFHSAETYIKRLVDKGYRIAICEQSADALLTKGLMERHVVRLISPGTIVEEAMLEDGANNYIACVYYDGGGAGLVFADISTGEVNVTELSGTRDMNGDIISAFSQYGPVELIYNENVLALDELQRFLSVRYKRCLADKLTDEDFDPSDSEAVAAQFGGKTAEDIGLGGMGRAYRALCGFMRYMFKAQLGGAKRFVTLNIHAGDEYMRLSDSARRSLELTRTMRSGEKRGSLLWVLDKTCTPMGKRKLHRYVDQPLVDTAAVIRRHDAVEELTAHSDKLLDIRSDLSGIYDLERLITRIVYGMASPRDVYALGRACLALPGLKSDIGALSSRLMKGINKRISALEDIADTVSRAMSDKPPATTREGGYIKDGFNEELDRLRAITSGGSKLMEDVETRERELTGIKNLRVGYNRVFGYYIEVSKGNVPLVPDRYIRRQTLVNGERYITEELKNIESEILGAKDKILALEAEIFDELKKFISERLSLVQETAEAIAEADVLCCFAQISLENNYTRPMMTSDSVIEIHDGRHPVVEKTVRDVVFTPNDVYLDGKSNRIMIITGPNMSGKSTFMRQVAVIVLMAQIGCFVPAKSARIGVVDKIFTRVGASDDLGAGQSTFMVEMTEVAEILKEATANSLVILDEIGRGTSTFDGISIAKAVTEYINSRAIGCKTLFATHYHELISLENEQSGIKNLSVQVKRSGDDIKFLHKIVSGGTDDSYGIQVARLAGLPKKVTDRAKELLAQMEQLPRLTRELALSRSVDPQMGLDSVSRENIINEIKNTDMDDMTPREAYQTLERFKQMLS